MLALLAAVPILLTMVLTVVFNMSAKKVLPIAWAVIVVIGYFAWEMKVLDIAAYSVAGFLGSIDTLLIIFGAILLMNILTPHIDNLCESMAYKKKVKGGDK